MQKIEQVYAKYIEANHTVCTDTRNIIPGSLFFALKGANFDGNKFAADALKKGAITAIIDNPKYETEKTILVTDALKCLQDLAHYYRKEVGFTIFALTGSNGKTTTKELINVVLTKKYKCHSTRGNLNNHIGVPLTILSAKPDSELLIVEMGANHVGEIELLCNIAEPDMGMITNIGKAHLEGFGGVEGVIKAKSELYTSLINRKKTIFQNDDDVLLKSISENYPFTERYNSKSSKCYAGNTYFKKGLNTGLFLNNEKYELSTQLFGRYNLTNILAAAKIGNYFKVETKLIIEALENYTPQNNRSQILSTLNNTLIMDSYNANPSSMEAALKSFYEIETNEKTLILGAMKELGDESNDEHKQLIIKAQAINPKNLFLVGEEYNIKPNNKLMWFKNTDALLEHLKNNPLKKQLILVKGSRTNALEKVANYL
jgi:UDP-N-acetylmuramoyl-tripeptide--D-alanyl-D-alanine ligase